MPTQLKPNKVPLSAPFLNDVGMPEISGRDYAKALAIQAPVIKHLNTLMQRCRNLYVNADRYQGKREPVTLLLGTVLALIMSGVLWWLRSGTRGLIDPDEPSQTLTLASIGLAVLAILALGAGLDGLWLYFRSFYHQWDKHSSRLVSVVKDKIKKQVMPQGTAVYTQGAPLDATASLAMAFARPCLYDLPAYTETADAYLFNYGDQPTLNWAIYKQDVIKLYTTDKTVAKGGILYTTSLVPDRTSGFDADCFKELQVIFNRHLGTDQDLDLYAMLAYFNPGATLNGHDLYLKMKQATVTPNGTPPYLWVLPLEQAPAVN